ncbi:MAG: hypothetical protein KDJ31_13925 [Candidatus Competibacteraceae bacterium]|nr:hypothetical protein [Candidatus Competibacteraceae bacterium]
MLIHSRSRSSRRSRSRSRRMVFLSLLALVGLLWGLHELWRQGLLPVNQTAADGYEVTYTATEQVKLPEDDAPHPHYMEWWYYSGHLWGSDQRRYSFHYALFVINSLATWTVAHASFLDQASGRHYTAQRRTAGKPTTDRPGQFAFQLGDWRMAGGDGRDTLQVNDPKFTLNLSLESREPPVLQGGTGLLDFQQAGSSYYYSRPRMRATGMAGLPGQMQQVTGQVWFDHQWGDFRPAALGWNWFALQLDNGANVMLYDLFDRNGKTVLRSGTYTLHGETVVLTDADFRLAATGQWTSPQTGATYPMGWTIVLPAQGINVTVTPVIKNSEFDGRTTSYLVYWEGAVTISGSHPGLGFVELSGYLQEPGAP